MRKRNLAEANTVNRPVTTDDGQGQGYPQILSDIDHAQRNRESDFLDLLSNIEILREIRQTECVQFLHGLKPLLEAAQKVNRELDFHTAHRFNALSYLRYDELGLSKIIADLLDPAGVHGQGSTFLKAMLELLSTAPEGFDAKHVPTSEELLCAISSAHRIQIDIEQNIDENRRIDVVVEIQNQDGMLWCLAFENKPYAGDQDKQCEDYLKFLARRYPNSYLLVYTPPHLTMPSESSLPDPDRWEGHFCVLPYTPIKASYQNDAFSDESAAIAEEGSRVSQSELRNNDGIPSKFFVGDGISLADWFGICSTQSNAERMRWFLREAQRFCQQRFGESNMTDTEARYIKEHLEKNPEQASAAYAVARAWPDYRDGICEQFLSHISDEIRKTLKEKDYDLIVNCQYQRNRWDQSLSIYKDSWEPYDDRETNHHSGMRTAIFLEFDLEQTVSFWGVRRPMNIKSEISDKYRENQKQLEHNFGRIGLSNPNDIYLHRATPKYGGWAEIVGELAKELEQGGGAITDYYVKELLYFVEKTVCIIDAEEPEGKNASS